MPASHNNALSLGNTPQYHTLSIVEYSPPSKDEIAKQETQPKRKRGRPRKDAPLGPFALDSNRMKVTKSETFHKYSILPSSRKFAVYEKEFKHFCKPGSGLIEKQYSSVSNSNICSAQNSSTVCFENSVNSPSSASSDTCNPQRIIRTSISIKELLN